MPKDTIQVLGGENKLLAYVDLCGISEFYKAQPLSRELAKKIGYGFLGTLKEVIDHDRMGIHILSDSALLVPKEKLPENQSPMDAKDIVKLCLLLLKSWWKIPRPVFPLIFPGYLLQEDLMPI